MVVSRGRHGGRSAALMRSSDAANAVSAARRRRDARSMLLKRRADLPSTLSLAGFGHRMKNIGNNQPRLIWTQNENIGYNLQMSWHR